MRRVFAVGGVVAIASLFFGLFFFSHSPDLCSQWGDPCDRYYGKGDQFVRSPWQRVVDAVGQVVNTTPGPLH
jgi:hypothetical protein